MVSGAYWELINDELSAERQRKAAIDARAGSVVSTSGALVALLAAVGAFIGTGRSSPLPEDALNLILYALGAFAAASVCGIVAGWTRPYKVPTADALEKLRTEGRNDEEPVARTSVAKLRIEMIARLRKIDRRKEWFLRASWVFQVGGLFLAAAAVRVLLTEI